MPSRSRLVSIFLFAFSALLVFQAGPARAADVLVRLPNGQITSDDVDAAVKQAGADNSPQARQRVLHGLVAPFAIEEQFTSADKQMPQPLAQAIAAARRQLIVEYYLQNQLQKNRPSDGQIEEFVRSHPQYFARRATFRFSQIAIRTNDLSRLKTVDAAVAQLQKLPRPTIDDVNRLKATIRQLGLPLTAQQLYVPSEQVPAERLPDLEQLAVAKSKVRVAKGNGGMDITILLARFPDPVDPQEMRMQVVQGMMQQSDQVERRRLLEQIGAERLERLKQQKPDESKYLNLGDTTDTVAERMAGKPREEIRGALNVFGKSGSDNALLGGTPRPDQMKGGLRIATRLGLAILLTPIILLLVIGWLRRLRQEQIDQPALARSGGWTNSFGVAAGFGMLLLVSATLLHAWMLPVLIAAAPVRLAGGSAIAGGVFGIMTAFFVPRLSLASGKLAPWLALLMVFVLGLVLAL